MNINWDKPIETVKGQEARVLDRCFVKAGHPYVLVKISAEKEGGTDHTTLYREDGSIIRTNTNADYLHELRNVKVKRVAWCLVSPKYCIVNGMEYYRTEELAKKAANQYELVARMEWEE